jgi:hypothetical protein
VRWKAIRDHAIEQMVAGLNGDILREVRMADSCIRQATCLGREYHPVVHRQLALCAAAALSNATALAAEVLALGGVPVDPGARLHHGSTRSDPSQSHPVRARATVAHYRSRLRMAERLGLLRLREVFQQIVSTKEWHLAHSGLIQTGDPAGRYLYS